MEVPIWTPMYLKFRLDLVSGSAHNGLAQGHSPDKIFSNSRFISSGLNPGSIGGLNPHLTHIYLINWKLWSF
jgi:hypothetical protein